MRRLGTTTTAPFAPFAGASLLAWIAVLVGSTIDWPEYGAATVLALAAGGLTLTTLRGHARRGAVPSALLFLAAVGFLRDAAGGQASSAGVIAIIPVFYIALYSRSRRALVSVLVGMALLVVVPILVVGGSGYPAIQYRAALLMVAVSAIIGAATQELVAGMRGQADRARTRERMLEQVTEAVHGLLESPRPRVDVCEAVRTISAASVAVLYEPDPDPFALSCTAAAGLSSDDGGTTTGPASVAYGVYRSGVPRLIDAGVEDHVESVDLWISAGRPRTILYQPLLRAGAVLGVLAVGWPGRLPAEGSSTKVAALLAHEAAAVIARADQLVDLESEAQTDALTGLPNRRAWDAAVRQAIEQSPRLTIAILDFDHFKQFNDTYGHPAGDRLLEETAAAWRGELRGGDLLARVGGEEFGLLLPGCDAGTALDVVERLRGHVTRSRTCSAGIAVRLSGEGIEGVVRRADRALYEAKARGRDRTWVSSPATVGDRTPPMLVESRIAAQSPALTPAGAGSSGRAS